MCPLVALSVLALPVLAEMPTASTTRATRLMRPTIPSLFLRITYLPFGVVDSTELASAASAASSRTTSFRLMGRRTAPVLCGSDEVAGDDRRQQEHTDDDVLGVAAEIRELHAVPQLGDEDQRQEHAEHRAGAAEDVRRRRGRRR